MKNKNTRRYLQWYEKTGDAAINNEDLVNINLHELQLLFNAPSGDPMYDCWEIKEKHVSVLNNCVKHDIDLEKFDYFIQASEI